VALDALTFRRFLEEAVAEVPDAPLLIRNDEHIPSRSFGEQVNRAANAWRSLGVPRGDRVEFGRPAEDADAEDRAAPAQQPGGRPGGGIRP
jgi:hypothetical protein